MIVVLHLGNLYKGSGHIPVTLVSCPDPMHHSCNHGSGPPGLFVVVVAIVVVVVVGFLNDINYITHPYINIYVWETNTCNSIH